MTEPTLRQRAAAAHFPEKLLFACIGLPQGDPAADRVLDGETRTGVELAKRIKTLLDTAERTGELPSPPPEAWERERVDPESTEEQVKRAQAEKKRQEAWLAERDAEDLAKRKEREAKLRAAGQRRAEVAIELLRLREEAGLSLREMDAFLGVDFGQLSRIERGFPYGGNLQRILDGYRAAARLVATKAAK